MGIHPAAAVGFERAADAYERGRPEYPSAAVAFLVDRLRIGPGATVVDLAAGTGKLTRMLTGHEIRLVAVEPVAAMRARLSDAAPGAIVMDGTAEAMPLATGSADAVTVAQAFHWFRTADALAEIHRVLRSGGGLGLIWNRRDLDQRLQAELQRIVRRHRTDEPTFGSGRWRSELEASPLFTIAEEDEFDFAQELDADGLVDRVMSTSVMAVLADADRGAVEDEIRALADAGPHPIRLRYVTEVYVCERV